MPETLQCPTRSPVKSRRFLRWLGWVTGIGCAFVVILYVFRAPLLAGAAEAWVVNEPVTKADAIVILGGGLENRPFAAAKLFREGVAPRILYMDVKAGPAEELGIVLSEREQTHRILLSNSVPDAAMTAIGNSVASTYDESRAVRGWMEKTGAKSILIPTDIFHTRRVRWLFHKELPQSADIHVIATDPRRYDAHNWWHHEEGVIAFQNEIIKFLYYRIKY
jgi:uncharacterized SAM-binding protein YcdF (DUF218 family)